MYLRVKPRYPDRPVEWPPGRSGLCSSVITRV